MFGAELMAAAMPASVLLVESMVIVGRGTADRDGQRARAHRRGARQGRRGCVGNGRQIVHQQASTCRRRHLELVVALAIFLSATVAANAASWLGSSSAGNESFKRIERGGKGSVRRDLGVERGLC